MNTKLSASSPPRFVVAVLTYNREAKLQRCLESLSNSIDCAGGVVDVLIGDNLPASKESETYIWNARRLHIGAGSVAQGRQALLEEGRKKNYDYLIFVDDDEIVSVQWYGALVAEASRRDSWAVAGPVLPSDLSDRLSVLYTRPRHPTGTLVDAAGAGNLLLDLHATRDLNFDVEWTLRGGEDTDFTLRLTSAGGTISWCDEALVHEPVDQDRLGPRWLIARHFNNGRILYRALRNSGRPPTWKDLIFRSLSGLAFAIVLPVGLMHAPVLSFCLTKGIKQCGFVYEGSRARFML